MYITYYNLYTSSLYINIMTVIQLESLPEYSCNMFTQYSIIFTSNFLTCSIIFLLFFFHSSIEYLSFVDTALIFLLLLRVDRIFYKFKIFMLFSFLSFLTRVNVRCISLYMFVGLGVEHDLSMLFGLCIESSSYK